MLPLATRLGQERTRAHSNTLSGEGLLLDAFRERKLLDYYLEPAAQKNGLTLAEGEMLLNLQQWSGDTRRELTDFAGVSGAVLSILLQRLTAKGMVSVSETKATGGKEKRLQTVFLSAAGAALADLEYAYDEYASARLSGFLRGRPGAIRPAVRTGSGQYPGYSAIRCGGGCQLPLCCLQLSQHLIRRCPEVERGYVIELGPLGVNLDDFSTSLEIGVIYPAVAALRADDEGHICVSRPALGFLHFAVQQANMFINRERPNHPAALFAAGALALVPNLHVIIVLSAFQAFVHTEASLNLRHIF